MVNGQKARRLFGMNHFMDNSKTGKHGVIFHPDFMHLVTQQSVQVKVSDLHGQKKFGVVFSVDIVFGAALGLEGAKKHIRITGS